MSGGFLDQIFLRAKEWLLSPLAGAPDWLIQIISSLINISGVLGVFLTLFALISVLERKILGRMQNRYGPNRVGPFGLFQPVADGIKMLIKEDVVPARADKVVHFVAPILVAATAILTLGVIPYGRNMTAFAIDGGILFFFAVGSTTELAVFMAGWGSNNKFSMLGAMRAIAQMVSYELPLIITVLPVVMVVGSLMPNTIVAAQGGYALGFVPRWFVFTPWGATAFILFFVSGLVESNRTPFDVPEGESEIGRTHDRIFRLQIRHVFHGGIHWDVCHHWFGYDFVSRWLARADPHAGIYSLLRLVFCEAEHAAFSLRLASRNVAPDARRSDHEFCLEIHATDGVHLHRRSRCLALCGARPGGMALVARCHRGGLLHIVDLARHAQEIRAAHLPFRRMNSVAFIVIAIFTL